MPDGSNGAAEKEIRQRIEGFVGAFRAKDLEGVLSLYAPEIVSFDLVPPLRYAGKEAYRRPWEEAFAAYRGPIGYEVHHLSVTGGDDIAFSHSLNRMSGMLEDGRQVGFWLRWTACFRRIDGEWRVVHEHVSVPVDLEQGTACLDVQP